MGTKPHIPRLLEVSDIALWLAVMIIIPLLAMVYGVLFVAMVLIPRIWRREK